MRFNSTAGTLRMSMMQILKAVAAQAARCAHAGRPITRSGNLHMLHVALRIHAASRTAIRARSRSSQSLDHLPSTARDQHNWPVPKRNMKASVMQICQPATNDPSHKSVAMAKVAPPSSTLPIHKQQLAQ